VPGAGDVGHTLRVQETATNAGGTSAPATSAATATVVGPPPANTAPPTISGSAQQGEMLTEVHGTWTNSPTSFTYQWLQCDNLGNGCSPVGGATSQTYVLASTDVGHTIRVSEEAHNEGGAGGPVESNATDVVTASASATFGTTTVGPKTNVFQQGKKRVNSYTLPEAGSVSKLTIYLAKGTVSGSQLLEGVIYSDAGGTPSALLGQTAKLTFTSTQEPGWYDLRFASPVKLGAGTYWIGILAGATGKVAGLRWTSVPASRDSNTNSWKSGPSNPFGSVTVDGEQMSLYATYTPG
jgi:hypothetical protein